MRSFLFFAFALALALPLVHSADEFPPEVPSGEGLVFCRAIFSNGTTAANAPLVLLARGNGSDTVYRLITDATGRFVLSLGKGRVELDSLLDMPATSGVDFAATASAGEASGNITLIFYPTGSLSGKTVSNLSPVPGASVRVACPSSSFDYSRINGGTEVTAGDAGDFLFRVLPVGTCVVSASSGPLAGSASAQVKAGEISSVTVELQKKALTEGQDWFPFAAGASALVLLLTIYLIYSYLRGKKAKEQFSQAKPAPEKTMGEPASSYGMRKAKAAGQKSTYAEESESGLDIGSPRAKAVLSTLSDREREIVRFLFKCGGRAKRSSIQHKLLIPKTSLLRNLRSLERKNIVKLTPFGRNLLAEIEEPLFK